MSERIPIGVLVCCAAPMVVACRVDTPAPAGADAGVVDPESDGKYVLAGSAAEIYEEILVPALFLPAAEDLVARLDLREGDRVLDVATGTGAVARVAAPLVGASGRVAGLDVSPGMLAVARRVGPSAVEWREGNALDLPYADGSFDAVTCQHALMFFPDRAKAVGEMHRVLAPGGRAAASVWRGPAHNPYGAVVADAVERHVGRAAGEEARSPFAWDDGDELASLFVEAGFSDVELDVVETTMEVSSLERFVRNDLAAYPLTGETLAGWDEARRDALVEDVLRGLSAYETDGVGSVPWAQNVVTGVKR